MTDRGHIHSTAVVAPSAEIGEGSVVGAYAIVGPDVVIGRDNWVGPHVVLEGRTRMGDGNRILQFASIGAGPQIDGWTGEAGRLTIGDRNVFRESVTVNAGVTAAGTRVGDDNLVMAAAHVGHDASIGSRVHLANAATLAGHVVVEDEAWISGLVAVHQHVRIGALAFVAGGSVVVQDAPPFCTVQGDRARLAGLNLVGLRRSGLSARELSRLRMAYRRLFLGAGLLEDRMASAREAGDDPKIGALLAFVQTSDRGVMRPRRAAA